MPTVRKKHKIYSLVGRLLIFTALLGLKYEITMRQLNNSYLTQRFRVEFADETGFAPYSGCYDISDDGKQLNGRVMFKSFGNDNDKNSGKFAYCKQENKWLLYSDTS